MLNCDVLEISLWRTCNAISFFLLINVRVFLNMLFANYKFVNLINVLFDW